MRKLTIIDAIKEPKLFRPFLEDQHPLSTWRNWMTVYRCIHGLKVPRKQRDLVKQCTGRDADTLPSEGMDSVLLLTGRRAGKSRSAAILGAYEAILAGRQKRLAKGEIGVVAILSPSRGQSRVVKTYLQKLFTTTPLLANEVEADTKYGFRLKDGTHIEIQTGDFRTVRSSTLLCAIVDEVAFFGLDAESKIKSDTELIRALKPGLATTGGKLICISSPYARKGWCWETHQKNFGNPNGKTFCWQAPSLLMNSATLSQDIVDAAMEEDLQAAKTEYLAEFRDDVAAFISRDVVEKLVVKGRTELSAQVGQTYHAFVDVSGGRNDSSALAIVLDVLLEYGPTKLSPHEVIFRMSREIKRFGGGITTVIGDNYAADFVSRGFEAEGLYYQKAEKPKSALYTELLPILCSGQVELLDYDRLVNQLCSLERRTRSGGRDIIDHPPGPKHHDDLANALAGVVVACNRVLFEVGAF
jgi:hypothetical protein